MAQKRGRSDQEQVVNKVVFAAEREKRSTKRKFFFPTCFLLAGEKERGRSKSAAESFLETKSEIWHNNTRPNHFLEEKKRARTHARTHSWKYTLAQSTTQLVLNKDGEGEKKKYMERWCEGEKYLSCWERKGSLSLSLSCEIMSSHH